MKISILLLTLNEAENLPRCLDTLRWCDDVVIVDSGSTDATLEIARRYNTRVLSRPFDNFAAQRNFGLENAGFRHEWVLHLDADEVLTPAFISRLEALAPAEGIDAYFTPSKTIMFGRWLKYSGMYPAYQVRLGRRGRLRFKQVGHGQREDLPQEHIGVFDEPYLHFTFSKGLNHWLKRHVDYAAAEAQEIIALRRGTVQLFPELLSNDRVKRRRAAKMISQMMPLALRPPLRFLYVYFLRCGFLDGKAGFLYAYMLAVYEANVSILSYELINSTRPRDKFRPWRHL